MGLRQAVPSAVGDAEGAANMGFAQTRAKAIRKQVDKMIQLAKDGSLHARRQVQCAADLVHVHPP